MISRRKKAKKRKEKRETEHQHPIVNRVRMKGLTCRAKTLVIAIVVKIKSGWGVKKVGRLFAIFISRSSLVLCVLYESLSFHPLPLASLSLHSINTSLHIYTFSSFHPTPPESSTHPNGF